MVNINKTVRIKPETLKVYNMLMNQWFQVFNIIPEMLSHEGELYLLAFDWYTKVNKRKNYNIYSEDIIEQKGIFRGDLIEKINEFEQSNEFLGISPIDIDSMEYMDNVLACLGFEIKYSKASRIMQCEVNPALYIKTK